MGQILQLDGRNVQAFVITEMSKHLKLPECPSICNYRNVQALEIAGMSKHLKLPECTNFRFAITWTAKQKKSAKAAKSENGETLTEFDRKISVSSQFFSSKLRI